MGAAEDLRLRPHSYWDRQGFSVSTLINASSLTHKADLKFNSLIFRRVRKIASSDYYYYVRHMSVCLSVCPSAWNNSAPAGKKIYDIWHFKDTSKIPSGNLSFINPYPTKVENRVSS